MKLTITIQMDDAAFAENPEYETRRILEIYVEAEWAASCSSCPLVRNF